MTSSKIRDAAGLVVSSRTIFEELRLARQCSRRRPCIGSSRMAASSVAVLADQRARAVEVVVGRHDVVVAAR